MTAPQFQVGARVTHKRYPEETGTIERGGRHTNNSPYYIVRWDSGGTSRIWGVDLAPATETATAVRADRNIAR